MLLLILDDLLNILWSKTDEGRERKSSQGIRCQNEGKIFIKLIPPLVGPNRSLEPPKNLVAVLAMKKLGF